MPRELVYLRNARFPSGELVGRSGARVSPDDRGFVFGDGVYEVIRSYSGRLFQAEAHMERLRTSLAAVRIDAQDTADLVDIAMDLLDRNGLAGADALVYMQVTRGTAPRAHPFPSPAVLPTLYVSTTPFALPNELQEEGVGVATLSDFRWARCDIKTVSLQANVLALQHAKEQGARECVFIRDGAVTEGTHANFMGVVDGVVRTHPATNHILAGITRAVVLGICARERISVREEALTETELRVLDEAFLTATSFEVTPVVCINGRPVGSGRPGPTTARLQALFKQAVEALPSGRKP